MGRPLNTSMKINLITVGKIREKYLRQGISEYIKRFDAHVRVELIEVGHERIQKGATWGDEERVREMEGERLLRYLNVTPNAYTIALDMRGVQMSSEELAKKLGDLMLAGKSEINFLIGGPLGLSEKIRQRADLVLSLSKMTFPHQMVSLLMIEQIYRAFDILGGGKYHK